MTSGRRGPGSLGCRGGSVDARRVDVHRVDVRRVDVRRVPRCLEQPSSSGVFPRANLGACGAGAAGDRGPVWGSFVPDWF